MHQRCTFWVQTVNICT